MIYTKFGYDWSMYFNYLANLLYLISINDQEIFTGENM